MKNMLATKRLGRKPRYLVPRRRASDITIAASDARVGRWRDAESGRMMPVSVRYVDYANPNETWGQPFYSQKSKNTGCVVFVGVKKTKTSLDAQSFQEVKKLKTQVKRLSRNCNDYKLTLALLKREKNEAENPRLRLLRLLRNEVTAQMLSLLISKKEVGLGSEIFDIDSLNILVELCKLGRVVVSNGKFVLTEEGKELAIKLGFIRNVT